MLTPDVDLSQLLSRVALGDRAAFEQLYKRTCAHLLGVAVRVLHNTDRAEEVLQDAFMNVWHNAGSYNPSVAQPMTWLINIIRNKAIDALRSGKTEASRTQPMDDDSLQVAGDTALEPQQFYTLVPEGGLREAHADDRAFLSGAQWTGLQATLAEGSLFTDTLRACAPLSAALKPLLRTLLHYHCGVRTLRTRQMMVDIQSY